MLVDDLSPSMQNYIKAIWGLQEWSDEPISPSTIAETVGVRLSTVSDAVRKLGEQGLVDHVRYGTVALTDLGRRHAVSMVRRHRLIESFLVGALGYEWDEVHDEADRLEHAVSDTLVSRIDAFLGFPTRDPHGDPIPSADGVVHRPDATQLSEIAPGCRVRVERISDSDGGMLQYFASQGIIVDAVLEVQPGEPFSGTVQVQVAGSPAGVSLGAQAAASIWASTLSELGNNS